MSLSVSRELPRQDFPIEKKFEVGDMVRRVGDSFKEGAVAEALGLIGTIDHFSPGGEWPPKSGKMAPDMYFIHFPELYKGTMYEGVMLGVVAEDLVLQRKGGLTFSSGEAASNAYLTEKGKTSTFTYDWSFNSVYFQLGNNEVRVSYKLDEPINLDLLGKGEDVFKRLLYHTMNNLQGSQYLPKLEQIASLF
jgi:hypothetical protein